MKCSCILKEYRTDFEWYHFYHAWYQYQYERACQRVSTDIDITSDKNDITKNQSDIAFIPWSCVVIFILWVQLCLLCQKHQTKKLTLVRFVNQGLTSLKQRKSEMRRYKSISPHIVISGDINKWYLRILKKDYINELTNYINYI